MLVLSLSFNVKAQVTESISPNVIAAAEDDLKIEMQTIDGEVFLVKKKAGAKPEETAAEEAALSESVSAVNNTPKKEITASGNQLSNSTQKNIQINVDAKKFYNNSVNNINNNINLENVSIDNTKTEIKNNKDSLIQKDVSESTTTKQDTKTDVSNQEMTVKKDSENVSTEANTTETNVNVETTVDNSTVDNSPVVVEPVTPPVVVDPVPPVVVDPVPPVVVDPVDPVPPVVVDPVDPIDPPVVVDPVPGDEIAKKETKYFVRGGFGLGTFTTLSDVESNYSFGLGFGYDINDRLNIELQYTLTEFEDTYSYNGYYSHDQVFKQSDFAAVLNYLVLHRGSFDLRVRGGLNYAHRTYSDEYYGYSNSSNSMSVILGLGGDIKVDKNVFITANADYYYNFSDNGYNIELDTLDLVAGQNYFIFNIGVKYKF